MKKKELQRLVDEYHDRNKELQDEVKYLREELQRLTEDFVKNYDYVILHKNYNTTQIYKNGIELDKVTSVSFERDVDSVATITVEMR